MSMLGTRRVRLWLTALLFSLVIQTVPAAAEVRMTFWSRDTSNYFPHAFFTLKGTLDATGQPIDESYGFTLNDLNPIALFTAVPAHVDHTNKKYIRGSDAQFRIAITDAQYAAIKAQVAEWGAPGSKWSLNKRNCVFFVAEAARRAGLIVVEDKRLMKKPKSFTRSLIALNPGRVTVLDTDAAGYWAKYPKDENFAVPADNKASVLERRMSKRPKVEDAPMPAPVAAVPAR
ncbi:hypothetical protein ACFSC3_10450 [Sphingomonas floccifaciens]|uniref:DUF4105 domain-containing protein n=1 Tax=Sphingomonas floccifaciens TaxID=1844115 RepID=A0ABW4NCX4_9SPHN